MDSVPFYRAITPETLDSKVASNKQAADILELSIQLTQTLFKNMEKGIYPDPHVRDDNCQLYTLHTYSLIRKPEVKEEVRESCNKLSESLKKIESLRKRKLSNKPLESFAEECGCVFTISQNCLTLIQEQLLTQLAPFEGKPRKENTKFIPIKEKNSLIKKLRFSVSVKALGCLGPKTENPHYEAVVALIERAKKDRFPIVFSDSQHTLTYRYVTDSFQRVDQIEEPTDGIVVRGSFKDKPEVIQDRLDQGIDSFLLHCAKMVYLEKRPQELAQEPFEMFHMFTKAIKQEDVA